MLTRATRLKLIAFALVGALVIAYTGLHYANLGRYLGARNYYVVRLYLASGGGIYPNADVTYRGVSVGRVGTMRLTSRGIEVDLNIRASAPRIPAMTGSGRSKVAKLRPAGTAGEAAASGAVPSGITEPEMPAAAGESQAARRRARA